MGVWRNDGPDFKALVQYCLGGRQVPEIELISALSDFVAAETQALDGFFQRNSFTERNLVTFEPKNRQGDELRAAKTHFMIGKILLERRLPVHQMFVVTRFLKDQLGPDPTLVATSTFIDIYEIDPDGDQVKFTEWLTTIGREYVLDTERHFRLAKFQSLDTRIKLQNSPRKEIPLRFHAREDVLRSADSQLIRAAVAESFRCYGTLPCHRSDGSVHYWALPGSDRTGGKLRTFSTTALDLYDVYLLDLKNEKEDTEVHAVGPLKGLLKDDNRGAAVIDSSDVYGYVSQQPEDPLVTNSSYMVINTTRGIALYPQENGVIDPLALVSTVIHEAFHAVQFALPPGVTRDSEVVVEGVAVAFEVLLFHDVWTATSLSLGYPDTRTQGVIADYVDTRSPSANTWLTYNNQGVAVRHLAEFDFATLREDADLTSLSDNYAYETFIFWLTLGALKLWVCENEVQTIGDCLWELHARMETQGLQLTWDQCIREYFFQDDLFLQKVQSKFPSQSSVDFRQLPETKQLDYLRHYLCCTLVSLKYQKGARDFMARRSIHSSFLALLSTAEIDQHMVSARVRLIPTADVSEVSIRTKISDQWQVVTL